MTNDEHANLSTGAKLGIASDAVSALTILAALPYELGQVGIILPPGVKPWVAGIGLFSTLALRFWKRWYELRAANPIKT